MRTRLLTTVTIVAALTITAACGDSEDSADDSAATASAAAAGTTYPLTIESCGLTSTLEAAPQRIVVNYDLIEPLLEWGLGDRVVGWHAYNVTSPYPGMTEKLAELEVIPEPLSREALTALNPDLVISSSAGVFNADAGYLTREELHETGVATYIPASLCAQDNPNASADEQATLSLRGYDDLVGELAALGEIVDRQAEAEAMAGELTERMAAAEAIAAGLDPVQTAVIAADPTGDTIYGVYTGGMQEDYITRAGGVNPFRDEAVQFKELSVEELTATPLDVLLIDSEGDEGRDAKVLDLFPTWPAAQDERVGTISGIVTSSIGGPWVVEELAALLHPDA